MVGSVGMVRGLSRPGSLVIQEALNLLSALGSDSEGTTTKLLMEMKTVQDHNGIVLADAKVVVIEANKREDEIAEEEAELVQNLKEAEELYAGRLSDIVSSEEELQRRIEEVNTQVSAENNSLREREEEFYREQEEHLESLRASKEELERREEILKKDREVLEGNIELLGQHQSSLEDSRKKIDSDRIVLNERKLKLDNRDARVLAAMKDEGVVEGR